MSAVAERANWEDLGRVTVHDVARALVPVLDLLGAAPAPAASVEAMPRATWVELRRVGAGLRRGWRAAADADLWAAHAVALAAWRAGRPLSGRPSLLTLKAELARRMASPCHLCELHCGARRWQGEAGPCGSADATRMAPPVILDGEEFGRGLVLSPSGCNTRCLFCSAAPLIAARFGEPAIPAMLARRFADARRRGATHQNWIGGNPDQHLPLALATLLRARTPLPLVWTANGAASAEAMTLLDGVAGAYVISFKFGSDACAAACGAALLRFATVTRTVERALGQAVPVIARVLALPGHLDCCADPVLTWLAAHRQAGLLVSLMRHAYDPSFLARTDARLGRPLSAAERAALDRRTVALGLARLDG